MKWEISEGFGKDEEMTLIIKGCLKFRKELEGDPSHLPFPKILVATASRQKTRTKKTSPFH